MNQAPEKLSFHGPYDANLDITVSIKYLYKSGAYSCSVLTLHCKAIWTTVIELQTTISSNGTSWQNTFYDAIPYKLSVRLNGVFLGPVIVSNLLWTRTACGIHAVSVMLHVPVGGQSLVVTQMTNDTLAFTSIYLDTSIFLWNLILFMLTFS